MSIKYSSVYIAQSGETLESIARAFRLSSRKAVIDSPGNRSLSGLSPGTTLAAGTRVQIPPNSNQLLKERLYALHAVRPLVVEHFDGLRRRAEQDLRDTALKNVVPQTHEEIRSALSGMRAMVCDGLSELAQASAVLADIGRGMAETHVGTANDQSVSGSSVDIMTGLYWLVSAQYMAVWSDMWNIDTWTDRWSGKNSANAWTVAIQYLNTVHSIVIQQIDARIREAVRLERALLGER